MERKPIMKKPNPTFKRSGTLALLLITATTLAGCMTDDLMGLTQPDSQTPYAGSERYPITVAKGPVKLEVKSTNGTLQPTQINAIIGFTHQAMSAGLTPITIRRPSGGGASAQVASEIASLVNQQGMPRERIRITTYGASSSAPVTLSYVSTYAKTKACGEWTEDVTDTSSNQQMNTHGCAVQANIAAMIADPQTLIVPAPTTSIPAESRMKAIDALKTPTASGSTKSTLGGP
jgi:pilus assembly protein CpaD